MTKDDEPAPIPAVLPASLPNKKRRKRNLRWKSLIGPFAAGNYLVVPLTCSDDLRDEGEIMNHCIGRRYHRWCHDDAVRVFSIRDLDDRRLATVSIYFDFDDMRWRLEQCKGYGNLEVCEVAIDTRKDQSSSVQVELSDIYFLAQDIVRLYQRAENESGTWTSNAPVDNISQT